LGDVVDGLTVDVACAPGGMLLIGTHKDRQKDLGLQSKEFPSSDDPAAVKQIVGKAFHRKNDKTPYHKPPILQAFLDYLFALRPKCLHNKLFTSWRIRWTQRMALMFYVPKETPNTDQRQGCMGSLDRL
jgi:hypothetical protein